MHHRTKAWGVVMAAAVVLLSSCGAEDSTTTSAVDSDAASTAGAVSTEVSDDGFRLELTAGDVPVVVEAGAGVAAPGTVVSADLVQGPAADELLSGGVDLPAVDIRLANNTQPRELVQITYDLSGRQELRDALSNGGTPLVVTNAGTPDRGLLPAAVTQDGEALVVETPHLSTFRPAVVDLGGKFSAAWKQQQERRAGEGVSADCPEPNGIAVGDTRARAQSSRPDIIDACVVRAEAGNAVVGLTNSSALFFSLEGLNPGALGSGEVPNTAETIALLVNFLAQGEEGPSLVPPNSRTEVQIPTPDLPATLTARVDPAATQYETILTGLDMLGVKSDVVQAALDSKTAFDCLSAGADTAQRPRVGAGEGFERFTTFGDCMLKASAAIVGDADSSEVTTVGTALTLIGTLPRQLVANIEGAAREVSGSSTFDISVLTGKDAAEVDLDASGPGAPGDQASPSEGPGWYWLSDIETASTGNGYRLIRNKPGVINTTEYPNSFLGSYTTGPRFGDPNRATYALKGKCTTLDLYVGQSADSGQAAGPGRFRIWLNDTNLVADEYVAMNEDAHHLQIDVSGASRMIFQDDRDRDGGFNVWGSPRLYCSENPTPKR